LRSPAPCEPGPHLAPPQLRASIAAGLSPFAPVAPPAQSPRAPRPPVHSALLRSDASDHSRCRFSIAPDTPPVPPLHTPPLLADLHRRAAESPRAVRVDPSSADPPQHIAGLVPLSRWSSTARGPTAPALPFSHLSSDYPCSSCLVYDDWSRAGSSRISFESTILPTMDDAQVEVHCPLTPTMIKPKEMIENVAITDSIEERKTVHIVESWDHSLMIEVGFDALSDHLFEISTLSGSHPPMIDVLVNIDSGDFDVVWLDFRKAYPG
ncbi:hypothetical protein Taro_008041, partial [Colocasia esculenta]|nr:hypothetical protein [Colocasia esculenta]